jgi:large subunit ribosomal protein L9
MKVILLADVDRLGSRGQVVSVRDGYARNFLFPKKLALEGSDRNLAQLDRIKEQIAGRQARVTRKLAERAGQLGLVSVKTSLKMGEEGAFGAVTSAAIAELLAREGHEVDKHAIVLDQPIKTPGVYDIPVKLGHEVTATVKLWVVEESA